MHYQIKSFIQFILKSTSKHGIHSPFIYQFTANCLARKLNPKNPDFKLYKSYKSILLKNNNTLQITDFGNGSKYFKDNNRKICDIAKYAGISSVKAKLLIKIIDYFKPKSILELGTSLGISTLILCNQNKVKVTTIEGCENTLNKAKECLSIFGLNSISFDNNQFDNILPKIAASHKFDLIYFDGNHQKNATIKYFNECLSCVVNETIFIFDDIYLSEEMQESWQEIIKHKLVTASIDTFYFGLIFFRIEQPKQHFLIRTKS